MMARWFFVALCAVALGSGCCAIRNPHDSCGDCTWGPCFRPIIWRGECHECGPGPGQTCADCSGECGILPALRRGLTCGKGCGEIYISEWISDPPDCCDPCDQCGNWVGPNAGCNPGPLKRVLSALHGYRYCPPPDCGPVCGLCPRGTCGPVCGCGGEVLGGEIGHLPHGADIYYEGPMPAPHIEQRNILEENWNIPRTRPVPGQPIHKAQQPPRAQTTQHPPSAPQSQTRHASQPIGTGVRQARYQH
jgi:hypothetical protein